MQVVYVGPHTDGVHLALPSGREIIAEPGTPFEVPDDFGARMLEQPTNWQEAAKPAPAPNPKAGDK